MTRSPDPLPRTGASVEVRMSGFELHVNGENRELFVVRDALTARLSELGVSEKFWMGAGFGTRAVNGGAVVTWGPMAVYTCTACGDLVPVIEQPTHNDGHSTAEAFKGEVARWNRPYKPAPEVLDSLDEQAWSDIQMCMGDALHLWRTHGSGPQTPYFQRVEALWLRMFGAQDGPQDVEQARAERAGHGQA